MSLLISFLYLCLHIAVIVLVAYAIVWLCRMCEIDLDRNVLKAGKIVVALLIIIAVVIWASGIVGMPLGRL